MADKRAVYQAMEDWKIAIELVRGLQKQLADCEGQIAKNQQRIAEIQTKLIQAQAVEDQRFLSIEQAMTK